MPLPRRPLTIGLTGVAALGLIALGPTAASAHVTATPTGSAAGTYTVMTIAVPHGCEVGTKTEPTTQVRISIPQPLVGVTPTVNPNWTIGEVHANNDETDRVTEIDYTAKTPLAPHERDTFDLAFFIPPQTAGTTLTFPTVQECTTTSTKWDEKPKPGQSEEDLKNPAPAFEVGPAEATASPSASPSESASTTDAGTSARASKTDVAEAGSSSSAAPLVLGIVGVVLGAAGLILGGIAFLRTRKRG